MRGKIIQSRNPRTSITNDEKEYLLKLIDADIGKGKFDHTAMLMKLTLYAKIRDAR